MVVEKTLEDSGHAVRAEVNFIFYSVQRQKCEGGFN